MNIECLICNQVFTSNKELGSHMREHLISMHQYRVNFNLYNLCPTCGSILSVDNKSGFCYKHRDRFGINNPFFGKKHSKETLEKRKKILSPISKKNWQDPLYRNKVITHATGLKRSEEFKKAQSERTKQMYEDYPEQRTLRSTALKNSWDKGLIVANNNFSCNKSKAEKFIYNELQKRYPTIKNSSVRIGSKYFFPDIHVPDLNLIIEYYGDYWHANPRKYQANDIVHHNLSAQQIWDEDKKRIDILRTQYLVEIIWEEDFKNNPEHIIANIDRWINWECCSW